MKKIKNKKEKIMLSIVFVLIIFLGFKSIYLDPINIDEINDEQKRFAKDIDQLIKQKYDNKFIVYRLTNIEKEVKEEKIVFVGKIRKYILGYFPFSNTLVKIKYDKGDNYGEKNTR
ncbi:MAG: hypothetical protein ACQEQE_03415 [Bacillota bacterium]